jgi:hypothetical protein
MREINGSEYALSVLGPARRIEWEGDFPSDLRELVEPVFTPLEVLVPTWCQTVHFRYVHHQDATLKVEISVRNRWAFLMVGASWLTCTDIERQGSMIHEIVHMLFEPYQWNTARALDAYGPKEGTPDYMLLQQSVNDGLEQAVEDTARALQKLLHAAYP